MMLLRQSQKIGINTEDDGPYLSYPVTLVMDG
jgi:hypothetical protein